MADLSSAITRAGVSGGVKKLGSFAAKALFVVAVTDTASLSVTEAAPTVETLEVRSEYTQTWGRVGVTGGVRSYGDFTKVLSSVAEINVSDTAYLNGTEEPVDQNDIAAHELASLSISESALLFNFINATDSTTISGSETVGLAIVGVSAKSGSDTASLSLSEALTIAVTVAVTDTASLSLTETPTVAETSEEIEVADTASLSVDEAQLLEVFTGVREINATDTALLSASDSASQIEVRRIRRIAIAITAPRITIEIT